MLLVSGGATLRFENPDQVLDLRPGDHLLIPAGRRHRVERTEDPTIWLCVFLPDVGPGTASSNGE